MLESIFTPTDDSILIRFMSPGKRGGKPAHWLPALMLVWTVWVFFVPMFEADNQFRHWLWPTLASFVIFLGLYWRVYYRSRVQVIWSAWAMAGLGLALMPLNPGAQCYFIYACAYFPCSGTTRRATLATLTALALYSIEWALLKYGWVYWINGALVSLCIGFMNLNFVRKAEREAELRMSHDEVRRLAATAERERIGRDLHDLLGHTLSLITLKSELANKLFDRDTAAAKREMIDIERVARDALAQVRRAVTGIRAAGLAAEMASAKLLLESNGVHMEYDLADVAVPVEIETAFAMTVREAATNIQRHARASRASIALTHTDGRLTLRITDDGRGDAIEPGNGLNGMRERLAAVGAELRVESQRGRGTTLTASLPMPRQNNVAAAIKLRQQQANPA
ncbi:MAG: sensor histidine kinase [Xanthomonadaceae bacterium]|nr:sensor histidine kinase [Xanthomonadaceae bacterium]